MNARVLIDPTDRPETALAAIDMIASRTLRLSAIEARLSFEHGPKTRAALRKRYLDETDNMGVGR